MMRLYIFIILLLLLILLPGASLAQKSAVLVIVDGMGASYLYPELSAECVDGTPLEPVWSGTMANASARYTLWVPVPETAYGHAVIATGYSGADDGTLTYYDGTVFDSLRKEGYWCIGVLETGDTTSMVKELDAVVYDRSNSIYSPDLCVEGNDGSMPAKIKGILEDNPWDSSMPTKNKAAAYRQYDEWSLKKAVRLVDYLNSSCPGQKYLLMINVAGPDSAAHDSGFDSYRTALADLDPGLSELAAACAKADTVLVVTADHGMSFKSLSSKGAHASETVSERNESRLVPLFIYNGGATGNITDIYGQECVAPTLLSLVECPRYLSMCDGEALPWNDRPALELVSARPANVSISGPGFSDRVLVDGTVRVGGLEKGDYRLESGGQVQVVRLSHDTVVPLTPADPGQSVLPAFALFLLAGAIATVGVVIVLLRQR